MEAAHKAKKSRNETPTLELASEMQLPENTNCLTCSEDGRYLCLGHSRGLSVWCASSLILVAEWLQDRLEITSIQMTSMAETTYLLGTVDDMGVARVFGHRSNSIHLFCVINIMEDINKRSICLSFELFEGGNYGAASFSCGRAVWLEVYQFPSAAWLKELEMAQNQNSSGWSPVTVMVKINPPKIPTGKVLDGPPEASQPANYLMHCLALDVIRSSSHQWEMPSFNTDEGKAKEMNESPRHCTQHFLLPCGPGDSKANFQSGLLVAVAVWWSGSRNLLQYFLQKPPKSKTNVEPMPDVLWPNAKEILCSAVSRCTRYIALGLNDALVCVWDRRSGAPLSVVLMPEANSAFFRIEFVDYYPESADDFQILTTEKVHLFVLCKRGAVHTVTTGRGTKPRIMQLSERQRDSWDLPTITASVPFLQGLSLVMQRSGKIFIQDVINNTTVCFLTPPTTHLITTPHNPIYALNSKQQSLFIRGDRDTSCSASSEERSQSQLFIFHYGESDIIKQYAVSHPESTRQQQTLSHDTLEETCNFYFQKRAQFVHERNKTLTQTWEQLLENAKTA
ncbi:LOW QUALITY PROTEIN: WD repeat-containing protein 93 [Archocentrus centrarchus]|uniref:LOW QUALITY PROTEIN: WD repeat-containing protein 93 n=1 Tax=Archocentrus centrarchus TaxID=63155 RepID=UPI0011E9CF54|nr:LOW QUALITY PROTEIN: WD repeat-containing protein 93 [Archocentrus centrarchus]